MIDKNLKQAFANSRPIRAHRQPHTHTHTIYNVQLLLLCSIEFCVGINCIRIAIRKVNDHRKIGEMNRQCRRVSISNIFYLFIDCVIRIASVADYTHRLLLLSVLQIFSVFLQVPIPTNMTFVAFQFHLHFENILRRCRLSAIASLDFRYSDNIHATCRS